MTEMHVIRALPRPRAWSGVVSAALAVGVATCLAIDVYVHLADAGDYGAVRTSWLSQATLFRIEGVAAAGVAAALLLWRRRWLFLVAAAVAVAGVGAVVLYTYVDVGRLGPVPNMYEPSWVLPGKLASAWAEGVGALVALAGSILTSHRRR
jgi:hypothetical protein